MSSDDIAISVRGVSKLYYVYDHPSDRLKQMLLPRLSRVVPGRDRWNSSDFGTEFWALRDIDLEVKRGESIGVLGRNGSGKSTLLQIIAGTLSATSGSVEIRGRVAALLELGSGFNPDFTGRENVLLNGMILGLSEKEVHERFDAIAGFADIGSFMDQPLKTYSSGMMLRLAFAVQTQIEPDILIVDEALAVGDALFQKRCLQQMERLRADGCSLLFVSHDQESVRTMTSRAILLRDGAISATGSSAEVVLEYRRQLHEDEKGYFERLAREAVSDPAPTPSPQASDLIATEGQGEEKLSFGDREAEVLEVLTVGHLGAPCAFFYPRDRITVRVRCRANIAISRLNVNLRLRNKEGVKIYSWGTLNQDIATWFDAKGAKGFWHRSFVAGEEFLVDFEFDARLGLGFYEIQASVSQELTPDFTHQRTLHWRDEAAFFQVSMRPDEYRFGGVVDLAMKATYPAF